MQASLTDLAAAADADAATRMPAESPEADAAVGFAMAIANASAENAEAVPATEVVQRSTDELVPEFKSRLDRVIARMRDEFGLEVRVIETIRSQERQDRLYTQGRTAAGPTVTWTRTSNHTLGRAADVRIEGATDEVAAYRLLARVAGEEGLRTLGPSDPGHLELPPGVKGDRMAAAPASDQVYVGGLQVAQVARVAQVAAPAGVGGVARIAQIAAIAGSGGMTRVQRSADAATGEATRATPEAGAPADPRASGSLANTRVPTVAERAAAGAPLVPPPATSGITNTRSGEPIAMGTDARIAPAQSSPQGMPAALANIATHETTRPAPLPPDRPLTNAARAVERAGGTPATRDDEGQPSQSESDLSRFDNGGADDAFAALVRGTESSPQTARGPQLAGANGTDIAARVARLVALQEAVQQAPTTGVTLLLNGADGGVDTRIRLGLRGGMIDTTIDVTDPLEAVRLAGRSDELKQVLERRGLDPASVLIREAGESGAGWLSQVARVVQTRANAESDNHNPNGSWRRDPGDERNSRRNAKEGRQ
jgi:hypothetical protein